MGKEAKLALETVAKPQAQAMVEIQMSDLEVPAELYAKFRLLEHRLMIAGWTGWR